MPTIDAVLNTGESADYPRPSVTVDVLIFTISDEQLKMVLIKRGIAPYKNKWAIPGGFVHIDESLEDAARREIEEEAGIQDVFLEQLYTFGDLKRDPRGRVITVAYYALVPCERLQLAASSDATEALWFAVDELPPLAFDHDRIVRIAVERLKSKLEYSNVAFGLLPTRFRLTELQKVYEVILGRKLDKRNFRKRIASLNLVEPTGKVDSSGAHRPAQLFQFKEREIVFV